MLTQTSSRVKMGFNYLLMDTNGAKIQFSLTVSKRLLHNARNLRAEVTNKKFFARMCLNLIERGKMRGERSAEYRDQRTLF